MDTINRIKELMADRNWSAYRLGKEANLPSSTINNMFKRNNSPSIPTLESICKAFDITIARFFIDAEGEDSILTPAQTELLSKWDKLSAEQKQALLALMDTM
jgi:transcriptional regulator with XRE-family HTH domain